MTSASSGLINQEVCLPPWLHMQPCCGHMTPHSLVQARMNARPQPSLIHRSCERAGQECVWAGGSERFLPAWKTFVSFSRHQTGSLFFGTRGQRSERAGARQKGPTQFMRTAGFYCSLVDQTLNKARKRSKSVTATAITDDKSRSEASLRFVL